MQSIRFFRRLRGFDQKDLACILGKTPAMICRYEQGKAPITAVDLQRIADYLNVPIQQFFKPLDLLQYEVSTTLTTISTLSSTVLEETLTHAD